MGALFTLLMGPYSGDGDDDDNDDNDDDDILRGPVRGGHHGVRLLHHGQPQPPCVHHLPPHGHLQPQEDDVQAC